jgi:hypothetical protein
MHGGEECVGNKRESQSCNDQKCPST